MGNETSVEEKQEKVILRSPYVGQASDLYWASRNENVDTVKQILSTTPFDDLNRFEPNGSTALHAATSFGHVDVVRVLLLERRVMRHRKNRLGLTPYEEGANDEIRALFHRPNSSRFGDNSENMFTFATNQLKEPDENDEEIFDEWMEGTTDMKDIVTIEAIFECSNGE